MKKAKLLAIVAPLFFIATSVIGQEGKTATISGYVKDAANKTPLIEAVITITSDSFEGSKLALTDSTGIYSVKNLPAGNYTIVFEMEGFKKFKQENIVLKEGMRLGISFEMARENMRKSKVVEKIVID